MSYGILVNAFVEEMYWWGKSRTGDCKDNIFWGRRWCMLQLHHYHSWEGYNPTGSTVPPNYSHPLLYQHPYCNNTWSPSQKINRVDSESRGSVAHVHRYIFAADQAATLQQQQQQRFVPHTYHCTECLYLFTVCNETTHLSFLIFALHSDAAILSSVD